jgi:hypothetical protein
MHILAHGDTGIADILVIEEAPANSVGNRGCTGCHASTGPSKKIPLVGTAMIE